VSLFDKTILTSFVMFVGTLLAIIMYQIIVAPLGANSNSPDFGMTTGGLFCLTCPISYAIVGLGVFGYIKLASKANKENKD
jgi:hypothetical protein